MLREVGQWLQSRGFLFKEEDGSSGVPMAQVWHGGPYEDLKGFWGLKGCCGLLRAGQPQFGQRGHEMLPVYRGLSSGLGLPR